MSNIDSKPLENLAKASLAQDREIAILRKKLSNARDELSSVTTEYNDVLDVLIAADMWTGNPPYRGVSAAGQVQMILDTLATMTAERDALKAQLDAATEERDILRRQTMRLQAALESLDGYFATYQFGAVPVEIVALAGIALSKESW